MTAKSDNSLFFEFPACNRHGVNKLHEPMRMFLKSWKADAPRHAARHRFTQPQPRKFTEQPYIVSAQHSQHLKSPV